MNGNLPIWYISSCLFNLLTGKSIIHITRSLFASWSTPLSLWRWTGRLLSMLYGLWRTCNNNKKVIFSALSWVQNADYEPVESRMYTVKLLNTLALALTVCFHIYSRSYTCSMWSVLYICEMIIVFICVVYCTVVLGLSSRRANEADEEWGRERNIECACHDKDRIASEPTPL